MSTTPIQLTGNLTRDPDLQFLPSGRPVARFDVAVNSRRRTEAGEWIDGETSYYPCSAWGELAEHLAESLTRFEVTADEVAASLRWATAAVTKAARGGRDRTWDDAPAGAENGEEAPF